MLRVSGSELDRAVRQLGLPGFDGDVDDLVQLVRRRRVAAADLQLAKLTGQFRIYAARAVAPDLDAMGGFVSASARLLALKSAELLVLDVEQEDDREQEVRDPDPRIREAACTLQALEGVESFAPAVPVYLPERTVQPHSPLLLQRAWQCIDRRGESRVKRVAVPAYVRLEITVSALIRRLRGAGSVAFGAVLGSLNRAEAVLHFVALLELVRRRQVQAEQTSPHGEITVTWNEEPRAVSERVG